jgi:hypothetical protein
MVLGVFDWQARTGLELDRHVRYMPESQPVLAAVRTQLYLAR